MTPSTDSRPPALGGTGPKPREPAPAPQRVPAHHRMASTAVLGAMLVAGIFMWIGNPYLWVRIVASQAKQQSMTMGQFLILLGAISITGIVMVKVLQAMQGLYGRLNGGSDEVKVRMPWTKSMRDSGSHRHHTTALDVIMVASVSIAVVAFGIWFIFLGGLAGGGGTFGNLG